MFTKFEKDVSVHQSLADEPNVDNGLSAEGLKKKWDKPAEDLKQAFNNLIDEMWEKTGDTHIGSMPLVEGDTSGATVRDKLLYLLAAIQNVTLGQIPDGSVTKEKLDSNYTNTLAVKNGEIQPNLNTEKIGGKTLDELASYFMVTGSFSFSANEQTISLGFTPRCIITNSGATRYGSTVLESTQMVTTERPKYVYDGGNYTTPGYIEIVENGFKFKGSVDNNKELTMGDAVEYGTGYRYIAFR